MTLTTGFPDLLSEIRAFRAHHPDVSHVDLLSLDIPGHFYGKRYPIDMLEKVAAGSPLKLPQNCVLLGVQGGLFPIGDYCFNDGDPDAIRRLIPGTLKPVTWEREPLGQMLISSDGTAAPIEFEPARSSPACCSASSDVASARWWHSNWSSTCSTGRSSKGCRSSPRPAQR